MFRDRWGLEHFEEDERTIVELGRLTFRGNSAKLYLPKRVCNALRLNPYKDATFIMVAPDNSSLLLIKDSEIVEMLKPKISKLRERHPESEDIHTEAKDSEPDSEKSTKRVEIEKILEVLIKFGEEGKFDNLGVPDIVETAKQVQQDFKNIDYLSPKAAFELGKFKVEMETMFNRKLQEKTR